MPQKKGIPGAGIISPYHVTVYDDDALVGEALVWDWNRRGAYHTVMNVLAEHRLFNAWVCELRSKNHKCTFFGRTRKKRQACRLESCPRRDEILVVSGVNSGALKQAEIG